MADINRKAAQSGTALETGIGDRGVVVGDRLIQSADTHPDYCGAFGMAAGGLRFVGASAVGQMHIRKGVPRDDAFAVRTAGPYLAVAVADGVGSKPQSRYGASFSVEVLCEQLIRAAVRLEAHGAGSGSGATGEPPPEHRERQTSTPFERAPVEDRRSSAVAGRRNEDSPQARARGYEGKVNESDGRAAGTPRPPVVPFADRHVDASPTADDAGERNAGWLNRAKRMFKGGGNATETGAEGVPAAESGRLIGASEWTPVARPVAGKSSSSGAPQRRTTVPRKEERADDGAVDAASNGSARASANATENESRVQAGTDSSDGGTGGESDSRVNADTRVNMGRVREFAPAVPSGTHAPKNPSMGDLPRISLSDSAWHTESPVEDMPLSDHGTVAWMRRAGAGASPFAPQPVTGKYAGSGSVRLTEEAIRTALQKTWQHLDQFADSRSLDIGDLACTLLCLVVNTDTGELGVAHVGDGLVAGMYSDERGARPLVEPPTPGKGSAVYPFTLEDWEDFVDVRIVPPSETADLTAILLMTDGVSNDCTHGPPDNILTQWTSQVLGEVQAFPQGGEAAGRMVNWLANYQHRGSGDDRTLVVVMPTTGTGMTKRRYDMPAVRPVVDHYVHSGPLETQERSTGDKRAADASTMRTASPAADLSESGIPPSGDADDERAVQPAISNVTYNGETGEFRRTVGDEQIGTARARGEVGPVGPGPGDGADVPFTKRNAGSIFDTPGDPGQPAAVSYQTHSDAVRNDGNLDEVGTEIWETLDGGVAEVHHVTDIASPSRRTYGSGAPQAKGRFTKIPQNDDEDVPGRSDARAGTEKVAD